MYRGEAATTSKLQTVYNKTIDRNFFQRQLEFLRAMSAMAMPAIEKTPRLQFNLR